MEAEGDGRRQVNARACPRWLVPALLLALLILPGVVLALLAVRVGQARYREEVGALRARLERAAAGLRGRVEEALADAGARARKGGTLVAHVLPWGTLDYNHFLPDADAFASDADYRHYRLALAGGESFEFERRDPVRAVDAYSFYLPRIESSGLRALLRFHAARAAEHAGWTALARALREGLFREAAAVSAGETSIDLLAGLALLRTQSAAPRSEDALRQELLERVHERETALSTPMLEAIAERLGAESERLARLLGERRALEGDIARFLLPERDATRSAWLTGDALLLASYTGISGTRAVQRSPVTLPPLDAGEYDAVLSAEPPAENPPDAPGSVLLPVDLEGSSTPIAWLRVNDPRHEARVAALAKGIRLERWLVGVLLALTVGAAGWLVAAMGRERRLAALRRRLLANVSHELKTPVTSLRIFAEMLAHDPLDAERVRRFGRMALGESERLGHLIENLLDHASDERSRRPLAREPVVLADLLRRVAEPFVLRAEESGVEMCTRLGAEPGAEPVVTNAEAVARIVSSLLDNALKYRQKDGAWIALELEPPGANGDGATRVLVRDNGPGIPRGEEERIFEEFYRVHYEDYGIQGAGLGLAIARRLAGRIGARLTVESTPGAGSVFALELPRPRTAAP